MSTTRARVVITVAEEPVVVNKFLQDFIELDRVNVVGLGLVAPSHRLTRVTTLSSKRRQNARGALPEDSSISSVSLSRMVFGSINKAVDQCKNVLALLLIFGLTVCTKRFAVLLTHTLVRVAAHLGFHTASPTLEAYATRRGINIIKGRSVNDQYFISQIKRLRPDIIVNQAPGILKDAFLAIPKIAVLNRHNSLLPRNRGRFSTFWALYRGDPVTGVTIHVVVKELDAGPIVAQKEVEIRHDDTVETLASRCYLIAPILLAQAIEAIERGDVAFLPNRAENACYNGNPTLRQAMHFRVRRLVKALKYCISLRYA